MLILKIRDGYTIRNIAGTWVAISNGSTASDTSDMVVMSDTGIFLWNLMVDGILLDDMVMKVTEEYEVDALKARKDIENFLAQLKASNLIEG